MNRETRNLIVVLIVAAILGVLFALYRNNVHAQSLTVNVNGCKVTPSTIDIICEGATPPAVCPPGQTGTPPNCTTPPLPGPPGAIVCPGYANTRILPIKWDPKGQQHELSASVGGFGANDILITQFTTGASSPDRGFTTMAESSGPPTTRVAKLSTIPCDLVPPAYTGQTPQFGLAFGSQPGYLQPNTVYYFNAKNVNCSGTCNVIVTLQAP